MLDLQMVNQERGLRSWHAVFSLWAWENRGTLDALPLPAFAEVPGGASRPGCHAGLPASTDCVTHFLTGPTFEEAVLLFLSQDQFAEFAGDLHWSGRGGMQRREDEDYGYGTQADIRMYYGPSTGPQILDMVRLSVRHVDTVNSVQQIEALVEAEDFTKRWQDALPGSFMTLGDNCFKVLSTLEILHPFTFCLACRVFFKCLRSIAQATSPA